MSHDLSIGETKANEWDQAIADAQELLNRVEQRAVGFGMPSELSKKAKRRVSLILTHPMTTFVEPKAN